MTPVSLHRRMFAVRRKDIQAGDVALFRARRGLVGRWIARIGRGEHSHAGMFAYWNGELMLLEIREFAGGRAVWAPGELARRGVEVDVYRPTPNARRLWHWGRAVREMEKFAGCRYGWRNIFRLALRRLPVLRLLIPSVVDDASDNGLAPFCSGAVSYAMRIGGLDPTPNLADRLTEPADLARSAVLEYQFTIVPPTTKQRG